MVQMNDMQQHPRPRQSRRSLLVTAVALVVSLEPLTVARSAGQANGSLLETFDRLAQRYPAPSPKQVTDAVLEFIPFGMAEQQAANVLSRDSFRGPGPRFAQSYTDPRCSAAQPG